MAKKDTTKTKDIAVKKDRTKSILKKREIKKVAAKPAAVVKVEKKKEAEAVVQPSVPFIYAVGRRKEAVARVRISESGKGHFTINGRELKNYFPNFQLFDLILAPLKLTGQEGNHDILVKVIGGGKQGQAEAVRHAVSRALIKWQPDFKSALKKAGYLTRDARIKERKKFGLKKARKAPQWAKR